jgi:hypothetical protein
MFWEMERRNAGPDNDSFDFSGFAAARRMFRKNPCVVMEK